MKLVSQPQQSRFAALPFIIDLKPTLFVDSSSLTGSTFEEAGNFLDEESELITADAGLQSSIQDDEWEDLADAKASR